MRLTTALLFYLFLAVIAGVEAATGQPFLATATTEAIARLHGATPHPNPPSWSEGTTILVTPQLPGDTLAFTGGNTIVITRNAQHDEGVLRHELIHAQQYRRHTTFGATLTYLAYAIKLLAQNGGDLNHAHLHHPLELEAYREQFGAHWDDAIAALAQP